MSGGLTNASGVTAVPGSGGGVTSITFGTGLTGGTIATSGTVTIDPAQSVLYTVAQGSSIAIAANTSGDGLNLKAATAASAGNQQWSPRLRLTANGWATTPVASQTIDWIVEVQSSQGAANPSGSLFFSSSINGGAYTQNFQCSAGAAGLFLINGPIQANSCRVTNSANPTNGIYLPVASTLGFASNGVLRGSFDASGNFIHLFARADQSKSVQVPTTGFAITVGNNTSTLIINPAGTLATGTVTMPATPIDGQEVRLSSTQTVTTLTVSPNTSQTISNAPTTIAPGQGFAWIYHLATTNWFRLY